MYKGITKVGECIYELPIGFVPNMKVPARFFATEGILEAAINELKEHTNSIFAGFQQLAHVATMPGIYKYSFVMPDMHSGYGFSIGGVAAFDLSDPEAIISAGGVGYDINCGIRCFCTPLTPEDIEPVKQRLVRELNRLIPTGVGGKKKDIPLIATQGAKWAIEHGFGVEADLEVCEEGGCFSDVDYSVVSERAANERLED
jgi:tRNA-splicing ligase RtcB